MASEADLKLAQAHGVSPATVAALRAQSLIEGEHFKKEGRAVVYLPDGLQRMADLLASEKKEGAPDAPPVPQDGPLPAAESVLPTIEAELVVVALCPNKTFVRVRDAEAQTHAVQIRPNRRVRPGMKILCRNEGSQWLCIHPQLEPRR